MKTRSKSTSVTETCSNKLCPVWHKITKDHLVTFGIGTKFECLYCQKVVEVNNIHVHFDVCYAAQYYKKWHVQRNTSSEQQFTTNDSFPKCTCQEQNFSTCISLDDAMKRFELINCYEYLFILSNPLPVLKAVPEPSLKVFTISHLLYAPTKNDERFVKHFLAQLFEYKSIVDDIVTVTSSDGGDGWSNIDNPYVNMIWRQMMSKRAFEINRFVWEEKIASSYMRKVVAMLNSRKCFCANDNSVIYRQYKKYYDNLKIKIDAYFNNLQALEHSSIVSKNNKAMSDWMDKRKEFMLSKIPDWIETKKLVPMPIKDDDVSLVTTLLIGDYQTNHQSSVHHSNDTSVDLSSDLDNTTVTYFYNSSIVNHSDQNILQNNSFNVNDYNMTQKCNIVNKNKNKKRSKLDVEDV